MAPTAKNGAGVILKACRKDKVVHTNRKEDLLGFSRQGWEGVSDGLKTHYRGDLYGHIGAATEGYASVYRGFAYEVRNEKVVAPKLIICWCEEETSRLEKTAKSSQEKHALPNTACLHWTFCLSVFNVKGRGVPCQESCGRTSMGAQWRRSDLELQRVFLHTRGLNC
ncbi:hypothetical protein Tco_0718989 [Tanacetum coccineum]